MQESALIIISATTPCEPLKTLLRPLSKQSQQHGCKKKDQHLHNSYHEISISWLMIVYLFQICHCPTIAEKSQHCQLPCGGTHTITIEQTDPRTPHHTRTVKLAPPTHLLLFPTKKSNNRQTSTRPSPKTERFARVFKLTVPSCSADTLGLFLGFIRFTSNG